MQTKKHFSIQIFLFFYAIALSAWPCEEKLITAKTYNQITNSVTISTLYGSFEITEPVLQELIESAPMQRLKEIRQLGIWHYAIKLDNFTRYDHSIGVLTLVRKTDGSLKEQIAALLHDVSHTVFSHVGAFFFVNDAKEMDKFQDDTHEWYLHASGLAEIIEKYGYAVEEILPKHEGFKRLEQDLPNLCADRIDYNIRGALWDDLINAQEAQKVVDALHFEHGTWYFNDTEAAKLFAQPTLIMTQTIWGSAENFATGIFLADALKRAAQLGFITKDDVHFSTDTLIWNKLCSCNDAQINHDIYMIEHCQDFFVIDEKKYTKAFPRKFRGLDPLVQTTTGLRHLSELDNDFAHEYQQIQKEIAQPLHLRFTN